MGETTSHLTIANHVMDRFGPKKVAYAGSLQTTSAGSWEWRTNSNFNDGMFRDAVFELHNKCWKMVVDRRRPQEVARRAQMDPEDLEEDDALDAQPLAEAFMSILDSCKKAL